MSQAQHETFREELGIKYPAFGYALWEPGSRGRYHAVQVGDVGFIREGYFHRLFNVLHPASAGGDGPSNSSRGVPGNGELLQIRMDNHIGRSTEGYKEFLSKSIRVESRGRQFDAVRPEDDAQVTFSCSGRRGALLSLPFPAQREDTAALRDFGKFIVKNIDSWFADAEDLGLGIDHMEDIILVTGCHRARSWVIATFSDGQPGAQVSFGAEVLGNSGVDLEWRDARGGDLKLGPSGRNLPEDQCIFVRGFRVARFLKFWPRLRGQAILPPDVDSHGPDPGIDLRQLTLTEDTDSMKHQPDDPLHVLVQYISERAPDSDMALVHDDDLAFVNGAMLETLEPDGLIRYLRSVAPPIQVTMCDILPRDRRVSRTVREVKVATLSQNALRAVRAAPAPRIKPDIRSPRMVSPLPAGLSPPLTAFRPSMTHRHGRQVSADEPGYASAMESSAVLRPRSSSQVVRTPLASVPPLKGILKTGNSESSVVFKPSLIQQDRDGYASSPEKGTSSRPSQAPPSKAPQIASSTSASPSKPPATLHWMLLSFDPQRSKAELMFDFAREVDEITLSEGKRGSRPLSTLERNKSAAEPGLTEMIIHCFELPDWPVYVVRQSGIRCVDIFEAIRDTYNVVLTTTERSIYQAHVRDSAKKHLRRRDLLEGKTLFVGLDWMTPNPLYPNGCWRLEVGTPFSFEIDDSDRRPEWDGWMGVL